jgi:hypothetical protein
VQRHDPQSARTIGVDLKDIQSKALKIDGVTASGEASIGVNIEKANIEDSIEISNVHADGSDKKPLDPAPSSTNNKDSKKKAGAKGKKNPNP